MYILYPIGLVLTYLLLRYFCKCDRVYRGIFAEKREKQWDEIIVFVIYNVLLLFIFLCIRSEVGIYGRLPKVMPSFMDQFAGACMNMMLGGSLGLAINYLRFVKRTVMCHAISKQSLLKVIEDFVTKLDKNPYIKHKWEKSIFRIEGGVLDVFTRFTLKVELSLWLNLKRAELRDELVAKIQEASESEIGYIEARPGAVIWVNRAAIILLLSLWVIWIGWFTN